MENLVNFVNWILFSEFTLRFPLSHYHPCHLQPLPVPLRGDLPVPVPSVTSARSPPPPTLICHLGWLSSYPCHQPQLLPPLWASSSTTGKHHHPQLPMVNTPCEASFGSSTATAAIHLPPLTHYDSPSYPTMKMSKSLIERACRISTMA